MTVALDTAANFNDFFRAFFSHFFGGPLQTVAVVAGMVIIYRSWIKKPPEE